MYHDDNLQKVEISKESVFLHQVREEDEKNYHQGSKLKKRKEQVLRGKSCNRKFLIKELETKVNKEVGCDNEAPQTNVFKND